MVGNVGALRTPPVGPDITSKALDLAQMFISGWAKKDRSAIEAVLTELREAAKNNAEVYKQASAALNELSRREKAARELEVAARQAHESATNLTRQAHGEIAAANQALSQEREAFDARMKVETEALEVRERAAAVRADVLSREKAASTRLQNSLTAKTASADKQIAQAQALKAEVAGRFARVKHIIDEEPQI